MRGCKTDTDAEVPEASRFCTKLRPAPARTDAVSSAARREFPPSDRERIDRG